MEEQQRINLLATISDAALRQLLIDVHERLGRMEANSSMASQAVLAIKWAAPIAVAVIALLLR